MMDAGYLEGERGGQCSVPLVCGQKVGVDSSMEDRSITAGVRLWAGEEVWCRWGEGRGGKQERSVRAYLGRWGDYTRGIGEVLGEWI